MCNGFLRITCGVTHADLLAVTMAAELTELQEGNVFTGVCLSTGGKVSLAPCCFWEVGYLWAHVLSRGLGRVSLVTCPFRG